MMQKLILCLSMAGVFMAPASFAEQQIKSGPYKASVVELYTSEGCSSCPPADKFLSQLGKTEEADQIIPLAFHVDYWDYIGWKDPYAKADYTQRQRVVARGNSQSSIYTPEFVVDGAEARGSRNITDQVTSSYKTLAEADITLKLSDISAGVVKAEVNVEKLKYEGKDTPQVYLAVFENGLSSRINAGENRGRTLKHDYVVRYLSPVQITMSGKQHQFDLKLGSDWDVSKLGVTAVVKLQNSGRTLQAVKGML
jgi:hypothetical protein